jgi:protein gp37
MSKSPIEWTEETWNPLAGCSAVSKGCTNCYAAVMTKRLAAMGQAKYSGLLNSSGHFNGKINFDEAALSIPLKRKKPTTYFVNSMSDLFHEAVPFEFIDRVFAVMALCPQHTFQVLTKRPERMAEYLLKHADSEDIAWHANVEILKLGHGGGRVKWPLPNVWLGTSVEDQAAADARIPHLLRCPAAVRFLSCEPLLGPVDLTRVSLGSSKVAKDSGPLSGYTVDFKLNALTGAPKTGIPAVDWVICGGESGADARPMHPDWARGLRDQCEAAGVPFFFKQWGGWSPLARVNKDGGAIFAGGMVLANDGTLYEGLDLAEGGKSRGEALRAGHDKAALTWVYPVGKKTAGRELDGRTWDELPATSGGVLSA